ncbi:hypothetical protein [Pluralibacter gergoviae]|uniref:hypothetical protein n=1 Tax=Pluralibacter gergoviae TaxID=61647 RepID=UPI00192732A3|nr:hypothetical protein [Pluralibacter gergoviae]
MSETVIPETRVHKAPDGGAIVMNQLPAGAPAPNRRCTMRIWPGWRRMRQLRAA